VKERLIYNQSALCEKKNVDRKIDMRYISHMDISKALRGLIAKSGKSIRKTSIDLQIDRASLQRSLGKGANPEWKTIDKILDYLGYQIKFLKKKHETSGRKGGKYIYGRKE